MSQSNPQEPVVSPVTTPLTSICHLFVTRKWGFFRTTQNNSSGVLFQRRYVLTAAHNVHSTRLSKVRSIEVSVGKAIVNGAGTVGVSDWRVASGYGWRDFRNDYAVLKLARDIEVESPFTLRPISSEGDVTGNLRIAGYPGASGGERNGKRMFQGTGTASYSQSSPFLDYNIDTETGNSGGPVWFEDDAGNPVLGAIHVTELNGTHGRGRVADQTFVDEVRRMIAELA